VVSQDQRRRAIDRLTAACPSFPDWRDDDFFTDDQGAPLGYLIIGELCAHLVANLAAGDYTELDDVLGEAERMIDGDDEYAADLAASGVVEDLYQQVWHAFADGGPRPQVVRDRLGSQCGAYWDSWDAFVTKPRDNGGGPDARRIWADRTHKVPPPPAWYSRH
jgi:hypothetical protein